MNTDNFTIVQESKYRMFLMMFGADNKVTNKTEDGITRYYCNDEVIAKHVFSGHGVKTTGRARDWHSSKRYYVRKDLYKK